MKYVISILLTLFVLFSYLPAQADEVVVPPTKEVVEEKEVAPAVVTVEEEVKQDPVGAIVGLVKSIRKGDWRMVAALALALVMLLLAKVRNKISIFRGDRGGTVLVLLLSVAGALSTTLATGMDVDLQMFASALSVGLTAIGGYVGLKKLIWPKDVKPVASPIGA